MSRPHAPEEMNDRHIGTRLGQISTKTARHMGTETNRHIGKMLMYFYVYSTFSKK
jgi:hypothetical protein